MTSSENTVHPLITETSLYELILEDYKMLQSSHHKMLNAMKYVERKDYSTESLHMLLKIQELHQSLHFLLSECELEFLNKENPKYQTKQRENRKTMLRHDQKILRKWMPYILRDMLDSSNETKE